MVFPVNKGEKGLIMSFLNHLESMQPDIILGYGLDSDLNDLKQRIMTLFTINIESGPDYARLIKNNPSAGCD